MISITAVPRKNVIYSHHLVLFPLGYTHKTKVPYGALCCSQQVWGLHIPPALSTKQYPCLYTDVLIFFWQGLEESLDLEFARNTLGYSLQRVEQVWPGSVSVNQTKGCRPYKQPPPPYSPKWPGSQVHWTLVGPTLLHPWHSTKWKDLDNYGFNVKRK